MDMVKTMIFGFIISMQECASLTSDNNKSRIRAVNKLTDQKLLYKIALVGASFSIKDAAMKRLIQKFLVRVNLWGE